jgi:hypothetical protein
MSRLCAQDPPSRPGMRMLWPRLETGNSSVTPCSNPMRMACRYDRCGMPVASQRSGVWDGRSGCTGGRWVIR